MKYYAATVTASTDTTLVAAPTSPARIRVLGLVVTSKTAVDAFLYSGSSASGALLIPIYSTSANGGITLPPSTEGWFDCAAGEALVFKQSATGTTGVLVRYALIG